MLCDIIFSEIKDKFMLKKIDTKYFAIPTWRNEEGYVRYKKLELGTVDNDFLVRDIDRLFSAEECEQILKEIPYSLIVKLDEKTYGPGLYLGKHLRNKVDFCLKGEVYDFLTKDGVVIGKMEINFPIKITPNYYDEGEKIPVDGVMLPRDLLGHDWRPSFDDLVCRYCVHNPKALEYIPQETLQRFPKLQERKDKSPTQTSKNSSSGLGKM